MSDTMTMRTPSFRTRAILPALLLTLGVILSACSDEGPEVDLNALDGEWRYELVGFSGSGASCAAAPAPAWATRYSDRVALTGYQWFVDSLVLDCTVPGLPAQHWEMGENGISWALLDVYYDSPNDPTSGCLLTDGSARVGDSIITSLHNGNCDPEVVIDGDQLRAQRTFWFRYPDTTGAATYTLTGTVRLTRK